MSIENVIQQLEPVKDFIANNTNKYPLDFSKAT